MCNGRRPGNDAPIERPSRRTVLHIEDDGANLRLVARIFSRRPDLELISATEGLLGIDMARDRQPAIVILDLHLIYIYGAVVLECLRADLLTNTIPVVVVSGDTNQGQIQRLLDPGAVA